MFEDFLIGLKPSLNFRLYPLFWGKSAEISGNSALLGACSGGSAKS